MSKVRLHITGTICRFLGNFKRQGPLSVAGLLAERTMTHDELVAAGLVWPDRIVVMADFNSKVDDGTGVVRDSGYAHQYAWKSHRYPDAILNAKHGQRVSMMATLERWTNGHGDWITRPSNIVVGSLTEEASA